MTFSDLGVHPALSAALAEQGVVEPFPIQSATLPDAIAGRDILGRGRTGSGKTLAFGLTLLTRLAGRRAKPNRPLGLVLVPTRELAMQVTDVLVPLGRAVGLRCSPVVGGVPYSAQLRALESGTPVLIATPGRLIDLLRRGDVDLSDTEIVVLDEADQMADMGFLPQVRSILEVAGSIGQRLLFSATLDGAVGQLVRSYLVDPVRHEADGDSATVTTMEHHVLVVHPADKAEITTRIAAREGRTILFVRTQRGADRLATSLAAQGIRVGALHGGKTQAARTRALQAFRDGRTGTLVATNVAARGIHVDGISLVVHVDPPADSKDYVHRSGRTARAGESGVVVTLATIAEQGMVRGMTKKAGVVPPFTRVQPGTAALEEITGAKAPSGIPWTPQPEAARPARHADRSGRGRRAAGGKSAGGKPAGGKPRRAPIRAGAGSPPASRSRSADRRAGR